MRDEVARGYEELVRSGAIAPDEVQRALVAELDGLVSSLARRLQSSKKSSLGWLFSRGAKLPPIHGLYIWGGVGRGKTMLMDLFFRAVPGSAKRRVHFHEFMAEVHERLNRIRRRLTSGEVGGDDPIPPLAAEIAAEARLLCFDEFVVNDIADAMILGRLFQRLFDEGVTVVATSNVPPDRLYEGGLNRALFLPFIALLKQRMTVFHLDSPRDYRLDLDGAEPFYVSPLGPRADACLAAQFRRLSGRPHGEQAVIRHKGRRIVVPEAANGVARFAFDDLCGRPLGAGDYLKIAEHFHTVILAGIPLLGAATRNEARRFINLVDAFYDRGIRLVASAAAEPEQLWQGGTGPEAFEFARTASRLVEMRSETYWAADPQRPSAPSAA